MNRVRARGWTLAMVLSAVAGEAQTTEPPATDPLVGAEDKTAEKTKKPFVCFDATAPVLSLDFPSRYTDDSKNRSDFDDKANAEVEAALGPVDDFIVDLISTANKVLAAADEAADEAEPDRTLAADCVVDRLFEWASVDALSAIDTQAPQLSVPSRIGGMAMAYAQVRVVATPDDRQPVIEAWLAERSASTMAFFDTEAPPRASQNNLRAWAALGVGQVGLIVNDPVLLDWATASIRLVACTAAEDGSLPNEMWRGKLALHYQLHATSPLVVGAALLAAQDPGLFAACDGAIGRIARFGLAGAQDPALVEELTGERQSFDPDDLKTFEFAWLAAYLTLTEDADAATFAAQFDGLANSKLGGKQDLLWE